MNHQLFIAVNAIRTSYFAANAQPDIIGDYKIADDCSNQKLSFANDWRTEKHKIMLIDYCGKKT